MEEFDLVKQFNEDVDSILAGKPQTERNDLQSEYDDLLDLATVLTGTNPIPEKGTQQALRRDLINRCLAQNSTGSHKEAIMKNIFSRHRSALLAGSFAIIALLGLYLIFPGKMIAMAKDIGNIFKIGSNGPYVVQIDDKSPREQSAKKSLTPEQQAQLDKNGYYEFTDDKGNVWKVGTGDKGSQANTVNYTSLADAQKNLSFKLLAPKFLPEGYSFNNAERYKDDKEEYITLNYKGPGKDIILIQEIIPYPGAGESAETIEPVTVNGNSGAWVDSSLTWNINKVNYALFAEGFSKDEIIKIAESVQ